MKRLLLVDGHSIANRAFYGVRMLSNSQGVYTNAIFGFLNILLKTIDEVEPDAVAVAFDQKAPTFRHKIYADYKGTRKGMPEELHQQIPLIQKLLREAGIPVVLQEGIEADDILGTLAVREAESGEEAYILSGDRDLLQLARPGVTILLPHTGKEGTETLVFDAAEVENKYGVTPEEFLQMKALRGDDSDNIPGVPGIGDKTAAKLIQTYHTVDNTLAHADEVKPARIAGNLKEYADQARLSLKLATIITDAEITSPLSEDAPDKVAPYNPKCWGKPEVLAFLRTYELRSFVNRFAALSQEAPEEGAPVPAKGARVHRVESLDEVKALISHVQKQTKDGFSFLLRQEDDGMFGYFALAVSAKAGEAWVMEEGPYTREELLAVWKPLFENANLPKIGHDAKEDMHLLASYGVRLDGLFMDTMIAAYLLNASKDTYSIDELSQIDLHEPMASDAEVFGTGKEKKALSALEKEERLKYLGERAEVLFRAAPVQLASLREKGMEELYRTVELPLVTVLFSMEEYGIRVNPDVLAAFGKELEADISRLQQAIYDLAGEEFNIQSPKQLGEILFDKLMLPAGKKTKSGYSTSADILEKLAPEYPIVRDILEYRQLTKLKSTYVEGLYPCIRADGKIHSRFNQTVTATGRLSSSDPNLQNIPIRTELGRRLRKAFVPSDDSFHFMDADYSQIELRILAHMSGDEKLIGAYKNGGDIHRLTASQVLGIPPEEVTPEERSRAKAVNFGIIYGISAFSLSDDLHITQKQAKEYIDRYYAQYPSIHAFLENCVTEAKEKGYSVTMFGRRRVIDELKASNFVQRSFGERVAKNMPIQGTAADIIKIAMVRVYERLKKEKRESRLLITVHDELLIETKRGEEEAVERILREEMMGAADLLVPLEVDIHVGEDWYEAK